MNRIFKEKNMKKKISLILAIIMIMGLCGCGIDGTGSWYTDYIYVDSKTGVNYIWINTDSGVTMQPRYNADGTLYVTK